MARVLRSTPATSDQDHLHLIVDSDPTVPDRNLAIAGKGPSPGPHLAAMGQRLETAGADYLVMVCNTAHLWADEIRATISIPLLSIIDVTVDELRATQPDAHRVGILIGSGCFDAGLYQRALSEAGYELVHFDPEGRAEFMALLYAIKAGDLGETVRESMKEFAGRLVQAGADVIIAGCTEVGLLLGAGDVPIPLIDCTDVLVKTAISAARS